MTRVIAFVGTRADLGPLEPVLDVLVNEATVDLFVLCGVAFDAPTLRALLTSVDGAASWQVVELSRPITSFSVADMLKHGPLLAEGMSKAIERLDPDVLLVLGDRWELLFVTPPAYLAEVPIVHLHGGEITEGALDERVRHAVTKLADVHCVASEDSARRVRQMGEPADRVIVTGAPGLDRLAAARPWSLLELAGQVGAQVASPIALFTYHPPTAVPQAPVARWAAEALRATLEVCTSVIVTHPGMDAGREEILAALEQIAGENDAVVMVESLGPRFPRVLATVDVMVGNSSSGIVEAATLGLPVVNIGERQSGRLRGANVLDSPEGFDGVCAALRVALTPEFRKTNTRAVNPYGDGEASPRIVEAVLRAPTLLRGKKFVDAQGPA